MPPKPKPKPTPRHSIPTKPQLHSRRHHYIYCGTHELPTTVRIFRLGPLQLDDDQKEACVPSLKKPIYAVQLYYPHNRACTIYRTWNDFATLLRGLTLFKAATAVRYDNVEALGLFLREALVKRPKEFALESCLRRRMGDRGDGSKMIFPKGLGGAFVGDMRRHLGGLAGIR